MSAIKHYTALQKSILRALAEQVCATITPQQSVEQLTENPVMLHGYVSKIRINWLDIAQRLGQARASVYHWYNETHLRHISGVKMSSEDKDLVKAAISSAIDSGDIYKKGFYMRIRNMFAEKYSRQEIMMQYNNLLRSKEIRKILHSKRIDFTEVRSKAWREQKHLKTVPSVTTEPYKESVSFGNAPAVHVCLPSSQSNVRAPATPAISLSVDAAHALCEAPQYFYVPPMTTVRCMSASSLARNGGWGFRVPSAPIVFNIPDSSWMPIQSTIPQWSAQYLPNMAWIRSATDADAKNDSRDDFIKPANRA
ncbi:hypothetical protein GL50803_005908 [Giardia duodenalis]|uniref:Uncharacterized protein n=1 Tax=Giardia intestinalis (strain ATCC 50803 / WB clone C6) TaxID=184922 RepID=A8B703_GIAIC|nr:hypothetical protein GL50803_005908 [Giardia intestinalis]KAE8301814.1 hypothetical protein GL50803_005908 [Giardia intestinalis]|eukprot:XP_001709103.1 Hypothetical protein GL50803_5908 [Giardia lamblia ATCC 50803]